MSPHPAFPLLRPDGRAPLRWPSSRARSLRALHGPLRASAAASTCGSPLVLVLAVAAAAAQAQQPVVPTFGALPQPSAPAPASGGLPWDDWPDRYRPDDRAADAGVAEASPWSVHLSPGTWHANPSEDHRHSVGLGLRRALDARQFVGVNAFSNSFGQPSAYAMYGQRLYGGVPALPRFYLEWTAGLMYGYVGERADEVPLNVRGFSPVFTLSPGWQLGPSLSAQLNVIGTVAVMLQLDWRFR